MTRQGVGARWGVGALLISGLLSAAAAAQVPGRPDVWAARDALLQDVVLRWDPVAGATGYRVYRNPELVAPFTLVASPTATQWSDVGAVEGPPLNPALLYYYVTAVNPSGEGPASNLAFRLSRSLPDGKPRPIGFPYRFLPAGFDELADFDAFCAGYYPPIWYVYRELNPSCPNVNLVNCEIPILRWPDPIEAGRGYYLVYPSRNGPATIGVVGAHDPAVEPGGASAVRLTPCAGCTVRGRPFGNRLLSIPWHALARSAAALCAEVGADKLIGVVRDLETEEEVHYCGTTLPDFPLEPGLAYVVLLGGDLDWQPAVWRP